VDDPVVSGLAASMQVHRDAFRLALDLQIRPGEVVALLGPNGAGKSTALRAIAGLLPIQGGTVRLGDRLLADPGGGRSVAAYDRRIGVVFQDYLLFPHLTVLDNVAFGLIARGVGKGEARSRAEGWLARMGIGDLARSRPRAISGGQAQRVALARALATDPELLLLDEPLAALDARTRLLVRGELRRHLRDYPGATLVVTHDPVDAAVLADRLVVIESGRVVQEGLPLEVARRPRTDYVARLVGLNLLTGQAQGHQVALVGGGTVQLAAAVSGEVYLAFRPSAVSLFTERPAGSPRNLWLGRVVGLEPHGEGVRVEVGEAPDRASTILAEVTPAAVAELNLHPGREIWAAVKASDVEVYEGRNRAEP
jgi:molybdate transport system ATP-binding protein